MEFNSDISELKIKKGKDGSYRAVIETKIREEIDGKIKTVGVKKIIFRIKKQDIKLELEQGNENIIASLD